MAAIQFFARERRRTTPDDGRLKPAERVSDARRPAHTAAERIAAERMSDARGETCKGRRNQPGPLTLHPCHSLRPCTPTVQHVQPNQLAS